MELRDATADAARAASINADEVTVFCYFFPTLPTGAPSIQISVRNAAETLAACIPTVLEASRGKLTKEACDSRIRVWSSAIVRNAEIQVQVEGLTNFNPNETCVLMSNHQSFYDIPVLYYALGPNIRMVAKKELGDVPLFGRAAKGAGFIFVDRGNRESAIRSLDLAKTHLERGTSIYIAPEGTRSDDGTLLPFKKGGFMLALDMGVPIVPITLLGTTDSLPARALRSRAGATVRVIVHPRIPVPAGLSGDALVAKRADLMANVRAAILSGQR